jgi:cytochrome c553
MRRRRNSTKPSAACRLWMLLALSLAAIPAAAAAVAAAPGVQTGGQVLYEQLCASCHGAQGEGDGTVANDVLLRPRSFALDAFKFDTDADWQRGTDADLGNVIRNGTAAYGGSALMPPWSGLSDDDISALVAHIRQLQVR